MQSVSIEAVGPLAPYGSFITALYGRQVKVRDVESVTIPNGQHWYVAHYASCTADGMVWNTQIAVSLFSIVEYCASDRAPNGARLELHIAHGFSIDCPSTVTIKKVFEIGEDAFILQSIDDLFFHHDKQTLVHLLYNKIEGLEIIHQPNV